MPTLEELEAAKAVLLPKLEGFEDFRMLDLKAETRPYVDAAYAKYTERLSLIEAALADLVRLEAHGWPALPPVDFSPEALADLQENMFTLSEALEEVKVEGAARLGLTPSPPEFKED